MPDGWTLVERAPTAAPPPAPSGWTLVEPAPPPGVFRGTNEKDAAGNALVREPTADDAGRLMIEREQNRTAADRVVTAMPGIGPILDYFTDHPYQWLHDKVDEWGKAGPHAVVQGLTNLYLSNYAKGAHQVATGAAVTAAPMVAPELLGALAAAPVATGSALATGTAATMIAAPPAKKLAVAAGLTEDQAQLVEDAVGLGAGYVGAKATPQNLVTAGKVALSHVPGFRGLRAAGTLIDAAGEALASQRAAQTATEAPAAARVPSASAPPVATPEEAVADRMDRIIAEGRAAGRAAQPPPPTEPPALPPPTPPPPTPPAAPVQREPPPVQAAPTPAPVAAPAAPVVRPEPQPITFEALKAHYLRTGLREDIADAMARAVQQSSPGRFVPSDVPARVAAPPTAAAPTQGAPALPAVETVPVGAPAPPIAVPGPVSPALAAPPTPRPIMSPQMALNEVGLAARRLQVPMTLDEARAAAEFLQQGSTPPRAIQQWMEAGRPALEAPPVPPVPVRVPGPRDSIMSPTRAGSEVAIAARRLQIPLTSAQVDEAAAFVLNEGLTPKAAIARWMDTQAAPAAGVGPAAAPTRDELAADLAARLGTPSPAESEAAIDARWRRGQLKSPSGPTAARMKAEADARAATQQAQQAFEDLLRRKTGT